MCLLNFKKGQRKNNILVVLNFEELKSVFYLFVDYKTYVMN